MDYFLRLQALDGYQAKFVDVFGDRFSRVLCVHHTGRKGDNPHYHFCLTCDYKKQALRVYLKQHFDLAKGNRHLSLKDWDGSDKACSYLFHEGTEPVLWAGFSQTQIDSFKAANTVIQSKLVRPDMIVARALQILLQKAGDLSSDKRAMFNILFDIYKDNGEWLPNKFQWERVINKLRLEYARARGDGSVAVLKSVLFNEIFPFG
uniref:hypothetical protein n=1 Tax=Flavobacterium sp. TaxID=239 RepID=UPI004048C25A